MAFFSHHVAKRRTVWVTLVGWMLALLAGIANACLLQPQGPHSPASVVSAHDRSVARSIHVAPVFHVELGDQDGLALHSSDTMDAAQAACVKFCNDESSTVAKGKTAQTDVPGPLLVASIDWPSAVPRAAVATWRSVERPASLGPPLLIRFLRLTI